MNIYGHNGMTITEGVQGFHGWQIASRIAAERDEALTVVDDDGIEVTVTPGMTAGDAENAHYAARLVAQ